MRSLDSVFKGLLVVGLLLVMLSLLQWYMASYRQMHENKMVTDVFSGFSKQVKDLHDMYSAGTFVRVLPRVHPDLWINEEGWPANASTGMIFPVQENAGTAEDCVQLFNVLMHNSNVRASVATECTQQMCARSVGGGCLYTYYHNREHGFRYNTQTGRVWLVGH
jgi:hypothetical protein